MRIAIHPLFLIVMLVIALTGNIAMYSIIILSLLLHELGHLLAAKYVGARIKRCIVMPYGGEISFENEYQLNEWQLFIVAAGGPVATLVGIAISSFFPPTLAQPFIEVQLYLLLLNCLPLWPLDGGKIMYALLQMTFQKVKFYEAFLSLSLCFFSILILVALFVLQHIVLAFFCLFLWGQVYKEWKIRKYRRAFQKVVMNRLT